MFHQTGTEPGKTKLIPGNIQEKGKQYRLKYHIISTFNAAIGNTLSSKVTYLLIIATSIHETRSNYCDIESYKEE